MTNRAAHHAQQEASHAGRREPITPRRRSHQEAIDTYLQLQDRQEHGHLRHEHLTVDGRAVDVTEDDLGVVELRLAK